MNEIEQIKQYEEIERMCTYAIKNSITTDGAWAGSLVAALLGADPEYPVIPCYIFNGILIGLYDFKCQIRPTDSAGIKIGKRLRKLLPANL